MTIAPIRAALASSLALALLGGCSGSRPYNTGPARTSTERSQAFPINFESYAKLGYRLDWKGYPTITGSQPVRLLRVTPDAVAVLEQGSTLSILEPSTGGQRCAIQLANPLTRFTGLSRMGPRFVATSEADVFAVDPTNCNLVARQKFSKIIATNPLIVNSLMIVGTNDGELYAQLDAPGVGGVKMWGFAVEGAVEHDAVLVGDAVGAVSQSGVVFFVTPDKGALLGRTKIFGGAGSNPVANSRYMFVASLDQSLYAFAPQGARQAWRYRTSAPLKVQPTVVNDRLYCAVPDLGLACFDANTGKVLWNIKDFSGSVVASNKGGLIAFDGKDAALIGPARGDVIERIALPGVASLQPDKFDGGNLYAVSTSGVIAKFIPR